MNWHIYLFQLKLCCGFGNCNNWIIQITFIQIISLYSSKSYFSKLYSSWLFPRRLKCSVDIWLKWYNRQQLCIQFVNNTDFAHCNFLKDISRNPIQMQEDIMHFHLYLHLHLYLYLYLFLYLYFHLYMHFHLYFYLWQGIS